MLIRLEYVEKDVKGMYVISDPMVREYLKRSKWATTKGRGRVD